YSQEDSTSADYLFNLSLEDLMGVEVITAGKTLEKIIQVPASVVVISKTEIEKYGFSTIEEVLEQITGLFMTSDYYWLGTANFGVRGFYSSGPFNNIFILVNGVSQMEEYTRGTPLSKLGIPVETIDKIEIIRGPMSVIYGSGAFFGAINIITENNENNEFNVRYGTHNSINTHAVVTKKTDDFFAKFIAGFNTSDGAAIAYTDLTTNPVKPNGKTFLQNNGLADDATTKNQLSFNNKFASLMLNFGSFKFASSINSTKSGMMDGQPVLGEGSYFISGSSVVSAEYAKELSPKLNFIWKENYNRYNYYNRYEQDYENGNMNSNQISSYLESEVNLNYHPTEKTNLLFGIYHRYVPEYLWGGDYSYWGTNFVNFLTEIENPFSVQSI
ncbi:MAG TPA: hypothetical protein DCQ31_14885, partial [Bacteroidales bacterium]|nr:hypothetical protein [Bacteroidales bacterium]